MVLPDVLVCPMRPVRRLVDLDSSELTALMTSIQKVGRVIERAYGADALTVACQVSECSLHAINIPYFPIFSHVSNDRRPGR